MSMSPSGTSVSSRSHTSWCSRVARCAPRRWMPTRATGRPLFFSTTSCAMRTSVRRMSSSSRTTLYSDKRVPSWSHGTGLKGPCPRGSSRASGRRGLQLGLDQVRLPALGEGDLDGVEVARDDGVLEDLARLVADVAREVPRREVGEGEELHARVAGYPRCLRGSRVPGLARASALVLTERRLVHEQVGAVGVDLDRLHRGGVAGVDDPPARTVGPDDLLGPDAVDGLAALQAAEVRAFGDAQRACRLDVEAPRPVVLDERVAIGLDAVVDREGGDREVLPADLLVVLELDHVQRVPRAPDDRPQHLAEQRAQAGR